MNLWFSRRHENGCIGTLADISATLFWRAKCCVKAALVAPLATPANWTYDREIKSRKPDEGYFNMFYHGSLYIENIYKKHAKKIYEYYYGS